MSYSDDDTDDVGLFFFRRARKEVVIRRASSEPRVNDTSGFMYKESTREYSGTRATSGQCGAGRC